MNKPKGGRGHVAPYETKQMRVPEKLEPQIQELINRFRGWIATSCPSGIGSIEPPHLLDKDVDSFIKVVDKLKSEVECHRKLVDSLKYERDSLDKEVNQLHSRNGELNLEIEELKEQLKDVNKLLESNTSATLEPVDKLIGDLPSKSLVASDNPQLHPLKQVDLAKRLGKVHSAITYRNQKGDLAEWSKQHDPDQIGWYFHAQSKLYYPVE